MTKNVAILNEDNQVINIIVVHNDYQLTKNEVFYTDSNFAYIGGDYVDGYFYPTQPYPSWTRSNGQWQAPTPCPTDNKQYYWSEDDLIWREVTNS